MDSNETEFRSNANDKNECLQPMDANEDELSEQFRDNEFKAKTNGLAFRQSLQSSKASKPKSFVKTFKRIVRSKKRPKNAFKCLICRILLSNKISLYYHKRRHFSRILSEEKRKTNDEKTSAIDDRVVEESAVDMIGQKSSENYSSERENRLVESSTRPLVSSTRPLVSGKGYSSIKRVGIYCDRNIFEGIKQFICKFCGHKTFGDRASTKMAIHINGRHLRHYLFRCTQIGCNKTFFSPNTLRIHRINHLCGYGIENGKTMSTVCGNKSINRFRKRVVIHSFKFFKCSYNDCQYLTTAHSTIKRHIHNDHLCPYRIHYDDCQHKSVPNSIDIIEEFHQFYEEIRIEDQILYKCKKCLFISETLNAVLSHIKWKHIKTGRQNTSLRSDTIKALQAMGPKSRMELSHGLEDNIENREEVKQRENEDMHYSTDSSDEEQEERRKSYWKKWVPFKCGHCLRRFNDLLALRSHSGTHFN